MTAIAHFGELLALATALVWASAVILFKKSGETASPLGLNLFKNLLAFLLVLPTMAVMGVAPLRAAPAGDYGLLLLSGVLGIGIADTLFFKSLNLLGAARSAVVDCLYSPIIILLSVFWLGERITAVQGAGVVLIVSAVLALGGEKGTARITRSQLAAGIALGALSMAAMGVGIVMIKPLLERSPILWAVEVRFAGAGAFLLLLLACHPGRRAVLGSLLHSRGWKFMLPGSFLGAYIAILLWVGGMKYATASVASALNQASNLFIFIFAALFLKERITRPKLAGIVLGVLGVLFVMLGGSPGG